MADLFSTNSMLALVQQLKTTKPFLLNRYFPNAVYEESEEIHFDVVDKSRRIAPFVSPVVAGRIVLSEGYTTQTLKPAYIKDKRIFDGNRPFKRVAGEAIGGQMSPFERHGLVLASEMLDQVDMINRRLEVMAAELLRFGRITIEGELYPKVVVDFNRDVNNSITYAAPVQWTQPGTKPLDELQKFAEMMLRKSGVKPTEIVMGLDAWLVFREHPQVVDRIKLFHWDGTMKQDAVLGEGGTFEGTIDGFSIFCYAGWYEDPDTGTEQPILPSSTVLMIAPQAFEGIRCFGSIRDEQAQFKAVDYFPKSWVVEDPSVRYLLMQSAPLLVPKRPNASLAFWPVPVV